MRSRIFCLLIFFLVLGLFFARTIAASSSSCVYINSCSDYTDQASCNKDTCNVAQNTLAIPNGPRDPNAVISGCSWNVTTNLCSFANFYSNVRTCTNSDKGSTSVVGTVTAPAGTFADYCTDSNTLVDFSCQGFNVAWSSVNCPNGCINGACFQTSSSQTNNQNCQNLGCPTGYTCRPNGICVFSPTNRGSASGSGTGGYIVEFNNNPLAVQKATLEANSISNSKNVLANLAGSILPANWGITPVVPSNLDAKINAAANNLASERQTIEQKIEQRLGKSGISSITGHAVASNQDSSLVVMNEYSNIFNGIALNISSNESNKINNIAGIKAIYPNEEVQALYLDPSIPQTGANQVWQMDADGNNCLTSGKPCLTGKGVIIGVIDTGVDYTHPDLGGCTQAQFLAGNCTKVAWGWNFISNTNDPIDDFGHGTHVASIAAGNGTLIGVAPGATIYAYKVLDSSGYGDFNTVIAGIEQAVKDNVNIISLSLGGGGNPDDPVSQAIDNAVNSGVVAVIAAGNSGPSPQTIGSPGTAREAITVGAVYNQNYSGFYWYDYNPVAGQLTSFSSQGPVIWTDANGKTNYLIKPDILAPGALICAARWDSVDFSADDPLYTTCVDSKHILLAGTSMATPYISGVAALLLQKHPSWTPQEIKMDLRGTALNFLPPILNMCSSNSSIPCTQTSEYPPYSSLNKIGYGLVNTNNAIGAYSTNEIPCIAHIDTEGLIKGVTDFNGEAYCPSNNFANYSLYTADSNGNLNQVYFSNNSTATSNGDLDNSFSTYSLPEGDNTIILIINDKSGRQTKDAAIVHVVNVDFEGIGHNLNYIKSNSEEINVSFSFVPDSVKVEYYPEANGYYDSYSNEYIASGNASVISYTPESGKPGILGTIDATSLPDGGYYFNVCGERSGTWICSSNVKIGVVKEMLDGWPIEEKGTTPNGIINIANQSGHNEIVLAPSWCSLQSSSNSLKFVKQNYSEENFNDLLYSSASPVSNIEIRNGSYASFFNNNGSKSVIVKNLGSTNSMECSVSMWPVINIYNSEGNLINSIDSLSSLYNGINSTVPISQDPTFSVYNHTNLVLGDPWGDGIKGITDLSGNLLYNWGSNSYDPLNYYPYIGGSLAGYQINGQEDFFDIKMNDYPPDPNFGNMYIRGYNLTGDPLPNFPIQIKNADNNQPYNIIVNRPIIIQNNNISEIAILAGNFNVSMDPSTGFDFVQNLTIYLDLYSLSGSLIKQVILYTGSNIIDNPFLNNLVAGDFKGDGNQEIVVGYGVVNGSLYASYPQDPSAYKTFFKVIDGNGNIISSIGPINGYTVGYGDVIANINGTKSVVAVMSSTWATPSDKLISFNLTNNSITSFDASSSNNLIQGIVVGKIDSNTQQEVIANYRPRWYGGGPSGFLIYYENGTLKNNIAIPTLGSADDYWGEPPVLLDLNNNGKLDIVQESLFVPNNYAYYGIQIFALSLDGGSSPSFTDWPMYQHDTMHTGIYTCVPYTCSILGKQCGSWSNSCGGTLNCGTCSPGSICSLDGQCSLKPASGTGCGDNFGNCPTGGFTSGNNHYCNIPNGDAGKWNSPSLGSGADWSTSSTAALCGVESCCGISCNHMCTADVNWQIEPISTTPYVSGIGCGNCPTGGFTSGDKQYCNIHAGDTGRWSSPGSNSWSSWSTLSTAALCNSKSCCGISCSNMCATDQNWQIKLASGTPYS